MNILITNDDGIYAPGIIALAVSLERNGHNVTVSAPDRERSACAHSMTMDIPLTVKKSDRPEYGGIPAFAVSGTPADCVKIAVSQICAETPDVVLSGINNGGNLGTDVVYSGTVNAALEANMLGFPAVAFSLMRLRGIKENRMQTANRMGEAADLCAQLLVNADVYSLREYIYNINLPACPSSRIQGIKMCTQGICGYDEGYEKRIDPFGREYFWITGDPTHQDFNTENKTDVYWVARNFISVTPIQWNQSVQSAIRQNKCKIEDIKLQY